MSNILGNNFLAALGAEARKAWNAVKDVNPSAPADADMTDAKRFDAWRRVQIRQVCGVDSFGDVTMRGYGPLMTRFKSFYDSGAAMRAAMKDEDLPMREAVGVLRRNLDAQIRWQYLQTAERHKLGRISSDFAQAQDEAAFFAAIERWLSPKQVWAMVTKARNAKNAQNGVGETQNRNKKQRQTARKKAVKSPF